jgi:hypothetical protein
MHCDSAWDKSIKGIGLRLVVDADIYYLIAVMFGRFIQLAKTTVQRAPILRNSTVTVLPSRSVQM